MRSLYGLKSAGSFFWNHLAYCIHHLVFLPCPSDLDLWMNPMVRTDEGFNYCVYVLIYVNALMVINHVSKSALQRIDKYLKIETSSIGDPEVYLREKLKNET